MTGFNDAYMKSHQTLYMYMHIIHLFIVLSVGESKASPLLYYTYSTVQSSAYLYGTAVEITQAGSDATLLEWSASTIN